MINNYAVLSSSLQDQLDTYNNLMNQKFNLENQMKELEKSIQITLDQQEQEEEIIEEIMEPSIKIINIYL